MVITEKTGKLPFQSSVFHLKGTHTESSLKSNNSYGTETCSFRTDSLSPQNYLEGEMEHRAQASKYTGLINWCLYQRGTATRKERWKMNKE